MLFSACVERREHLTISPEGRVWWEVTHQGGSLEDLLQGDAVPRIEGGWATERLDETDENGRTTHRLHAAAAFGARHALPANYALDSETDGDLYLQFPSSVKFERRGQLTLCHFSRTYLGRTWAPIEQLRMRLVEHPLAEFSSLDMEDWTLAQRQLAVQALASFEVHKLLLFAREAFLETASSAPQDGWLAVRSQMLGCVSLVDSASIARMLEPVQSEVEQAAVGIMIQAESDEFHQLLQERLHEAVKSHCGLSAEKVSAFMAAYDRQCRFHEISEDLADDRLSVSVTMPGPIVASNADQIVGNTATWTLDGQMMRDQDVELLVTSVVSP